jgi:hypothetical protein
MMPAQAAARRWVLVPSATQPESLRRYRLARLEAIAFQPSGAQPERAAPASFGRSAVRTNG